MATAGVLLWNFFIRGEVPGLFQMALIWLVPLVVVVVFHLLIAILLPVRWPAIRGEFEARLETRLAAELERAYLPIPGEVTAALKGEREQVDALAGETRQVARVAGGAAAGGPGGRTVRLVKGRTKWRTASGWTG